MEKIYRVHIGMSGEVGMNEMEAVDKTISKMGFQIDSVHIDRIEMKCGD